MAIQDELARGLRGEVRADAYTRHLYAGDASMYASPPLLVAFPRDAADVAAAVRVAAERRRAGRQPRRRHEPRRPDRRARASCSTPRATWTRSTRSTSSGARARVGPGVVQDALNAAVKPHGLGFGPDTSTSNRATLGGMIGNNSSGSHSIVYGTTIDHVLELEVVLSDGITATFGPVDEAERRRAGDTLEGRIFRGLPEILREHARAIAEDYPHHWRQSGGYRLDSLARELRPRQVRHRLRGHARRHHRGDGEPDRAAEGAPVRGRPLPLASTRRSRRPRTRSTCNAAAIEMIDSTILELSRSKHEYAQMASTIEGDPGALLFVTFFADTPERGGRPARPAAGGVARARPRLPLPARRDRRRAGRADQGPQGRPRAADGRQRGRQAARRVRRGHRGGARAARRLRQGVPRDPRPPRADRRLLRPLQRRLPAHPPVRRPHRARAASTRWPPSPTRSPRWWRSSTASTPPSTATAASAARSTRACSATSSTRRCARSRRCSTPTAASTPA